MDLPRQIHAPTALPTGNSTIWAKLVKENRQDTNDTERKSKKSNTFIPYDFKLKIISSLTKRDDLLSQYFCITAN